MKNKALIVWKGGLAFESTVSGHKLMIDAAKEKGGTDTGPSPMELLLPSLATCAAMGAIGILKKMRVPDFELNIDVEAEQTTEHPKVFSEITVVYNFTGENLESAKLHKAVSVAEERFCGVNLMLSKTARINSLIKLNGDLV